MCGLKKEITIYESGLRGKSQINNQINQVKIGNANIDGIATKTTSFQEFIIEDDFDIFSINEAYAKEQFVTIIVYGFRSYYKNANGCGGASILAKEKLNTTQIIQEADGDAWCRFCSIKFDDVLFTSCYMSDNNKISEMKDEAYDVLNEITNAFPYNTHIFLRDLNALLEDFRNNYNNTTRLKQYIYQNDLQIINDPLANTFIHRANQQYYCNDYILATQHFNIDQFNDFQVHYDKLITDHIPISVTLVYNATSNAPRQQPLFFKFDKIFDPMERQNYQNQFQGSFSCFLTVDQDSLDLQYSFITNLLQNSAINTLGLVRLNNNYNASRYHYEVHSCQKNKLGVQKIDVYSRKNQPSGN